MADQDYDSFAYDPVDQDVTANLLHNNRGHHGHQSALSDDSGVQNAPAAPPPPPPQQPPPALVDWLNKYVMNGPNTQDDITMPSMQFGSPNNSNPIYNGFSAIYNGIHNFASSFGFSGSCYTGLRSDGAASVTHSNRQAPPGLDGFVQKGDVVYFDGNHAEMCVGKTKEGKAIWCSDTNQGTNFFVNDRCQNGSYVIYRPDANFDVDRGVQNLLAHAEPSYTHQCASYVRQFGINGGGGDMYAGQPGTAAGYLSSQGNSVLNQAHFHLVATGSGESFATTQSQYAQTRAPKTGHSFG